MRSNKMDYLSGTDIYLWQRKDMFRCNTDTALLGHFLYVKNNETLLDIGCNNGALMLYASRYNPKHLYGVDLFQEAIDLAQENLNYNKVENFTLYCGDATKIELPKVDVIVSNPPYFDTKENGNRNENEFLVAARHEGTLNLKSLFETASRTLKDHGRFYLVHRALRITDIIEISLQFDLRAKLMQIVYDEDRDEATAVLFEFLKYYHGQLHVYNPKITKR